MKKHHMLRTVLLSTVFALLTLVLLTPAASAHTSAPAHAAATSLAPASVPNVNIVIRHGKAVFSPTLVRCKAGGHKKDCFTITNLTDTSQKVLFGRQTLATIPPGFVARMGVGISGLGFVLNLKSNLKARLIVLTF